MQKAYLNPTPDQTFEVVGEGAYNFVRVLAHSRELQASGAVEQACDERFQAFQRLAGLIPDDEEVILEWNHRNSRAALELVQASAVDHFLINDFELSAALLEMLLDLDPEDHLEGSELLAFDYLAMDETELFD
ncbi:MAG: tetratricopeptide repeat protein, partial [Alistipes sp.]|nr:tetratricopeptide repeat protein [Alistipes sp.]